MMVTSSAGCRLVAKRCSQVHNAQRRGQVHDGHKLCRLPAGCQALQPRTTWHSAHSLTSGWRRLLQANIDNTPEETA